MKKSKAVLGNLGIRALEWFRAPASKAFEESTHFEGPAKIEKLAEMASEIVSIGNQTGEGWVFNRRDAGADPRRRCKYCLHTAICLPAEPRGRKRCHQRAQKKISDFQCRSNRL